MSHFRRLLIGFFACFVVLSVFPSQGHALDFFRKAKGGHLIIYLEEPEMVTVDVRVTLESVSVVDDKGLQHPFITKPISLESRALAGRQVVLGEVSLPEGPYRGLHFTFSEAFIYRGQRKSSLAFPEEGWTLEVPFEIVSRESETIFLHWDPARSLEMGFFFTPSLSAGREVRQINRLLVYVSNEGSNTVTVINRDSGRVVGTLAVPGGPRGMATSPDSKSLYVVSTRAGRLTSFRTLTNQLLNENRFSIGSEPQEVAVSPDGTRLFVTLYRFNSLLILDAQSLSPIEEVDVGRGPMGVVVEPEGRKVYVANSLSNDVSVVSAQSGALLTTVSVEPKPQRLAVTRDGSEVLVASYESSRLSAISVNTNQVSRTLTADRWLSDITLDSRLNRYYLVQDRTNRLLFYEPRSQLSIKTVVVGNNPFRVAVGPDLRTLFVVCRKDNTVVLINRISGEVETVLEVGKLPYDVKVVELP